MAAARITNIIITPCRLVRARDCSQFRFHVGYLEGCWLLVSLLCPFFPGPNPGTQAAAWAGQSLDRARAIPTKLGRPRFFFFLVEYAGLHLLDGGRWRCSLLLLLVLSSSSCSLSSVAAAPSEASRKMVDEIKFADARGLTCFFLRLYIVRYYFAIFVFPEAKAARA